MDQQLTPIIKESFLQFGGAVLQSRALPDVRDICKPSARQIFYCLYTDKFTYDKPFKKTLKAIGSAFRVYIHGDASAEGIIMRAGQPFAMRYPLMEIEGSCGTLLASSSWAAPRYCLTGDAFISTDQGLLKMQDIVKTEENSDNEIPLLFCRGAFGPTTTNLIFNSGKQPTYRLTLKNGIQISGTPNHPILTLNDKFEFIWKTIGELSVGDKILLNVRKNFLYGQENDIEYAKALGCLVSEGCLTAKNIINMINSDLNMVIPVYNLLHKYGSKAEYYRRSQIDQCYQISTTNKELYQRLWEDNCIHNSYNKHIPKSVFRGTREYQQAFLKYLFEGDGCISLKKNGYGCITYSSVSADLIRELQILLLSNFGIMSSISRQKNRKEIKLELGGEDVYLFGLNIGFVSNRKNEKLQSAMLFYKDCRNRKSTGSRGWRIFPEIRDFLTNYYPNLSLIIKRNNRPNECKGPLMSKDGLSILKAKLPYEVYSKIEFIYRNFVSIPIIKKEDTGLQIVYSPKINEACNSYTANGIINHNTEARLSKLGCALFADIQKDTIEEWRDNYDNTEQYPTVLPTKGFYNLVNGSYGIGVGASCSIPQYNLKEVNNALIKLLWNPNVSFDDIYCAPDFATGAILLNEKEIKESHKKGQGAACKLRSVIEWDKKDGCLIVSEIPYMVYTETICQQLETIINGDDNPGIERFNDLTGENPLIKIYLQKNANPAFVLKYLYKNTSLQSYYGVNFTALDNGRYPRLFTWKEMLQAHLTHEKEVYLRGYQFDLNKINARLHIIEGLLKAISQIEAVIKTIKSSTNIVEANQQLQNLLSIDENQAKAILDIKLSRLAHLEISKLQNEKTSLLQEKNHIEALINDETLLKKEIEKGLREVADKFGDERRTKILNLESEDGVATEEKLYQVSMTNYDNLIINETSSLFTQRRGTVGTKAKLDKGEFIKFSKTATNNESLLFFTEDGRCIKFNMSEIEFSVLDKKMPIAMLCKINENDKFTTFVPFDKKDNQNNFIIFITKKGYVKKSELSEYQMSRGAVQAIKLEDDDKIVNVVFTTQRPLGILTKNGQFILIETKDINPIGRVARGVIGIKLGAGDEVVDAQLIMPSDKELVFVSEKGRTAKMKVSEFAVQGRAGKGVRIRKLEDDFESKFLPIGTEKELLLASNGATLKINLTDLTTILRGCQGVQTMKLTPTQKIIGIAKI